MDDDYFWVEVGKFPDRYTDEECLERCLWDANTAQRVANGDTEPKFETDGSYKTVSVGLLINGKTKGS